MKRTFSSVILVVLVFFLTPASSGALETQPTKRPKLILTIVFDQFRGDYLSRFEKRFLPVANSRGEIGGFEYLMKRGAYFPYGQYDITQSMTEPGHATILTGSYPYQNGIVSNLWYDRDHQAMMYCSEDPDQSTVGATSKNSHIGTSPKLMNSTTVGDELKNAGYPSRVVSVSLKDRAAILMGGHRADLALWFDPSAKQWVSSTYYLPERKLPGWMDELNREVKNGFGKSLVWQPAGKSVVISDETHGSENFKHTTQTGTAESISTPYGAELIEQAAEKAFDAFRMGKGQATDLFAVSFSNHDYAGHEYGPNSREMEEITVAEDRVVSRLLNFVRKRVSFDDVVIVLTGDHGIPPNPDWLVKNRIAAGRIGDAELSHQIESAMTEKFGKSSKPWLGFFHDYNYYFTPSVLQDRGVSLPDAESVAKAAISGYPGVAYVLTSADIAAGKLPPGFHGRQLLKTFYPGRSADVTVIPKPFYMKDEDVVDHLTGYNYDRTVPIIFSGFGIRPGLYADSAEVVDIAPTLTFLAGTLPPDLSEGHVLSMALKSEPIH